MWGKLAGKLRALLLHVGEEAGKNFHAFIEGGAVAHLLDGGCELMEGIGLEMGDGAG